MSTRTKAKGSHSPPAHSPQEPAVWQYASAPRNLHFPTSCMTFLTNTPPSSPCPSGMTCISNRVKPHLGRRVPGCWQCWPARDLWSRPLRQLKDAESHRAQTPRGTDGRAAKCTRLHVQRRRKKGKMKTHGAPAERAEWIKSPHLLFTTKGRLNRLLNKFEVRTQG